MTKNDKEELKEVERLFRENDWENFLLFFKKIKGRSKDIISMYRKSHIELKELKECNWKQRYEAYKKGMGYKNKDIAHLLDRKLNSVEVSVTKEKFPDTFKLAILTYEAMIKTGSIIYTLP